MKWLCVKKRRRRKQKSVQFSKRCNPSLPERSAARAGDELESARFRGGVYILAEEDQNWIKWVCVLRRSQWTPPPAAQLRHTQTCAYMPLSALNIIWEIKMILIISSPQSVWGRDMEKKQNRTNGSKDVKILLDTKGGEIHQVYKQVWSIKTTANQVGYLKSQHVIVALSFCSILADNRKVRAGNRSIPKFWRQNRTCRVFKSKGLRMHSVRLSNRN